MTLAVRRDLRGKDKKGGYSQSEFWWRAGNDFYSAGVFDSRSKSLHELSNFQVSSDFKVLKRLDAEQVSWLDSLLGWNMSKVRQFVFQENKQDFEVKQFRGLPLPIPEKPQDFYEVRTDPDTMNFSQLRRFIKRQLRSGIDVAGYMADLYEKLAFPVFNLIVALVVLPFALKPARTRGMAGSVMAALVIGFSYYAVHSFSLALGRAELMPALLSAWLANLLMGFVAMVLMLGAEAP
ncbi:MAG: hypothetical protein DCC75_13960 [Proteobacteria bacterium]|nr:MAG: hypothetical protein DCC75_13960 [Pseudomonadota bacterium]